jgi:hypothetical protein
MMRRVLLICALLPAAALAQDGENWRLLADVEGVYRLSIADRFTQRTGDRVSLRYLLEHPVAYENARTGRRYRNTMANALIDCRANTYLVGSLATFNGPGASGEVDRYTPAGAEARFEPIVAGGSFDILRKDVCR